MCFWRSLNEVKLDKILEACESNGVQLMDSMMWMHHPRTAKMKELLSNPQCFRQLKSGNPVCCDYGLPKSVRALSGPIFNKAGALTPCGY
ncbi:putative oxidoreductase [Vitis vinifera]|uniref:Putative oxidoreductase n=1 Tax=Vitis vinifera TaxID=29760 RepID=A0A438G999_VITVI|nr:putative oxidoreductase [Vitis vinifera]